jgi:RNA polymerase sigma-70 factor (ECF subfamily)
MMSDASVPEVGEATIEVVPFDAFYRAEYAGVVRIAWSLTGRRALAEELAQDAFLEAHRRWVSVSSHERPDAWVRRVVINRSLSTLRRRATEARLLLRLGGPARAAVEPQVSEDADELWRAVRRLPRRQAEVVALMVVEDLTVEEVAAVLGCGVETVRTHYRRARLTLAAQLREADATVRAESGGADVVG